MRNKLLSALFIVMLSFAIIPSAAFAIEPDDSEFEAYLEDIGWEKDEFIEYLESRYLTLEDVESVDELGIPVTEESLEVIYDAYDITHDELNEYLQELGGLSPDEDIVDSSLFLFIEQIIPILEPEFGTEEDLDSDSDEIGGWDEEVTEENIQGLLDYYGFISAEELEEFLNSFGDSIENYETIWDLELQVDFYMADAEATVTNESEDFTDDFSSEVDLGTWNMENAFPTGIPAADITIGLMPIAFQVIFF